MSYLSSREQTRGHSDADNAVSIGEQEAALIWELRRLQRFLDEERDQQRFTHAIDLQSEDRPPNRGCGKRRPPAKQPDSKVERLLDKLGFNRRKPAIGHARTAIFRQGNRRTMTQKCWSIRQATTHVRRTFTMPPS